MRARRVSMVLGALVCGLSVCTAPEPADAARKPSLAPWCRFGTEFTGAVVADIAFHSPNPWLIAGGATYKLADLAHDIGDAAINRRDQWIGAEMVLADKDAKRLEEIKASGGNMKGDEATKIVKSLHDRQYAMNMPNRSPYGYTMSVIVTNLPYAVDKVALDKVLDWAVGQTLKGLDLSALIGGSRSVPETINWALNYGGPLEDLQHEMNWTKLGLRAREAEKAARDAIAHEHAQELKELAAHLKITRKKDVNAAAAEAVLSIYETIMSDHPSQPVTRTAPMFRLEVARAAVMAPAVQAVIAPREVVMVAREDPEVATIGADDAGVWAGNPRSARSGSSPVWLPSPTPNAAEPAWIGRMHAESALVGDGKTFAVCSNGCQSSPNARWEKRPGSTLYNK